jgi:glycosyltransferase involved in cell wall biosynthesis
MTREIGVAIATFNGMKYLEAQLESICQQTLKPSMISISDDCSTDGTPEFIEAFARRSSIPIVFVPNPRRGGVIENFRNAFAHCPSPYIAYCDQDDAWRPNRLAVCSKALEDPRVALVFHRSAIVNENLEPTGRSDPSNIEAGLYTYPYFPDYLWGFGHQMVFSRRVLEAMQSIVASPAPAIAPIAGNFDRALLVAAGMVGSIAFLNEDLVQFRRHQQSTSNAGKREAPDADRPPSDGRRLWIEDTRKIIDGMVAEFDGGRLSVPGEVGHGAACGQHLRMLQRRYLARCRLYGSASVSQRLGALLELIGSQAYGSLFDNKLPPRHLLLDAWRCMRGGRAT